MAKNKETGGGNALALADGAADSGALAIVQMGDGNLTEIMQANLGDGGMSEFDLERIKIPSGGGTSWTVNTLEGESMAKELEGVILHWREPRVYYSRGIEEGGGGGQPPDCYSNDGKIGIGNPGGACDKCPLSQWGSDPKGGKGQACKQRRLLFFLRPENLLPDALSVPPTSIKPIKQYFLRLASQAVPFYGVKTRLTLKKEKSDRGIDYARIEAAVASRLTQEELSAVKRYIDALKPSLEKVRVDVEDVRADKGDSWEG